MYSKITLTLLSILISTNVFSQITLATVPPNNGSGGIFLTITTFGSDVTISKFNTYFSSTALISVEVYTRPGAYTGFTTANTGWTLLGTPTATGAGSTTIAPLDVTALNIQIPASTVQSFYLHATTAGGGIRYTGTNAAPPVTTYSDANLQLFSDVSRTGTVAFAGNTNTPRTYAGSIEYFLTPLSVKWLNVSATNQKNTALITWEVEENDVMSYEVEKLTPYGYKTVTKVNSKGNGRNSYAVNDATAFEGNSNIATYHVKQYEKNGQSSYSSSVVVKKTVGVNPIEVYPNPFSNNIQVTALANQAIAVEDITGKTVARLNVNEGINNIQTQNWQPGLYFIRNGEVKIKLLKH